WQRRRITLGLTGLAIVFTLSAVGTYQAYHFTESPEFCGQVCHMVMKPEYTAYQYSSHAHVRCAECHIGSGADWYVKSKMSGLRQVWAVATKSYKLPIETPVHNLRPARETCEECHWPGKFSGSMEKEIWHFSPDQTNSPMRYNLLMKVGGGEPEVGQGHGIHWHINSDVKVRYWSPDRQRMTIPWVEVTVGDQPPKVFKTGDCPDPLPDGAEIRVMDCIDCHNRPSHVYRSPRQLLDHSFSTRILDSSLPFLKRYSTELLETEYPDTPTALQTIDKALREKYADRMAGVRGKELVEKNIALLQTVYQRNFFPEQGVSWREYPSHLGHFEFPGCYRCHDDKHLTETKEYISNDCTLCHKLVDQAEGEAAFDEPVFRTGPFQHPRNLGTIWEGRNCTDCHGLAQEKGEAKLASVE
ncbi:NapC/NirT family cytochrome c, partial [Candidatus Poribacteria bacterium]|nr:NapC/NirT family cytochrome c [Candidatus Poribacteria bacterium]